MSSAIKTGKDRQMNKHGSLPDVKVHIRWLQATKDMDQVMAIEHAVFDHPWREVDFLRTLRGRNCIGMVAEEKSAGKLPPGTAPIAGFMIYELHKTRMHIINFAVATIDQRRGVGSQMVDKLKDKLSRHRRTRLTLEVRESNVDAQLFFASQGFRAVNVLRDFYDDTDEDAYLMQYRLPPDAADCKGK